MVTSTKYCLGKGPSAINKSNHALVSQISRGAIQNVKKRPITDMNQNDVLCGRGTAYCNRPGNIRYHMLVKKLGRAYSRAKSKEEKTKISRQIVEAVHKAKPRGRFIYNLHGRGDSNDGVWFEVENKKAWEKTSQLLRETVAMGSHKTAYQSRKHKKERIKNKVASNLSGQTANNMRLLCPSNDDHVNPSAFISSKLDKQSHQVLDYFRNFSENCQTKKNGTQEKLHPQFNQLQKNSSLVDCEMDKSNDKSQGGANHICKNKYVEGNISFKERAPSLESNDSYLSLELNFEDALQKKSVSKTVCDSKPLRTHANLCQSTEPKLKNKSLVTHHPWNNLKQEIMMWSQQPNSDTIAELETLQQWYYLQISEKFI